MHLDGVSPEKFYDEVAEKYDSMYLTNTCRAENDVIFSRVSKLVGPGTFVFDLGCGTGLLLEYIGVSSGRYLGIDISEKMVEQARRKFPRHSFEVCDFNRLRKGRLVGNDLAVVSLFGAPSYFCDAGYLAKKLVAGFPAGTRFLFMFYSTRYMERPSYIAHVEGEDVSTNMYSCSDLEVAFRMAGVEKVGVRSFQCLLDGVNSLPIWLLRGVLRMELAMPWVFRDRGFFLIAEGVI